MRNKFTALLAVAVVGIASIVYALPPDNRGDVDSLVKIFFPYDAFHLSAAGAELRSFSSSGAVVTYISTGRMAGIRMTASNQDVPILISLPDNACLSGCPVQFGVVWSTNHTNTAHSVTWRIFYNAVSDGEAMADTSTANESLGGNLVLSTVLTTAFNTAITADTVDGSNFGLQESPLGTITSNSLSRNDILEVIVQMQATSAATSSDQGLDPTLNTILFHGINFYYTRELL